MITTALYSHYRYRLQYLCIIYYPHIPQYRLSVNVVRNMCNYDRRFFPVEILFSFQISA